MRPARWSSAVLNFNVRRCRSLGQCTDIGQVLTWNERIMAMSGIWCQYPGSDRMALTNMHAPRYWVYIIYPRSVVKIKRYIDMRIRMVSLNCPEYLQTNIRRSNAFSIESSDIRGFKGASRAKFLLWSFSA